jgi:hypothetical protein
MTEMKDQDREYLAGLVQKRHDELLHELHHTAARDYRNDLRREVELTEELKTKLSAAA